MRHECMRGALGNDIGIMAEHGTNEMTNGPTDWNRGPIGAPSKEGHGVIIQANKGRFYQDYRVPRAASRSPLPSSSHPSRGLLAPCLPVITGPNCSLFLLLSFSFATVISLYLPDLSRPLRCHPLVSFTSPSSLTFVRRLGAPPSPFPSAVLLSPPASCCRCPSIIPSEPLYR